MNDVELVRLVESTWLTARSDQRYAALKALRVAVSSDLIDLFDALFDAKLSNIEDDPNAIVVILVHGIQTDGAWHRLVQDAFSDVPNINVIEAGYDCVTAAQLVSPFRGTPIEKVAREMREARRREPRARMMVIAHSFGSYILSRILKDASDLEFERIILCGSIITRNYKWDLFARNVGPAGILNHVGTGDFYPVLATFASVGYGASGRLGFKTGKVVDRFFQLGHSGFFTPRHIRTHWLPFITDGRIERSDWDVNKPATGLAILILSHPWIGRLIGVLILCSLVFFGYGLWLLI
ncbi:hypothetical protein [Aquabacterium sp.]|uniref:hypothetical protein n=1 Tax=Aquabacterium sp. TaxID=1872578 RepID=UPI0027BAADC8|nr:hypothetical protein [Aquabacterium sp.]